MKTGDIVTIYTFAFTNKYVIGDAELIRKVKDCPPLELWEVRFLNEGFTQNMLINPELCEKQ